MNEIVKNLTTQVKNILEKLTLVQKIIIGSVIALGLVAMVLVFSLSTGKSTVLLFQEPLGQEDARTVMSVLDASGINYKYANGFITLDPNDRMQAELELVKEGKFPEAVNGWEIFDTQRIAITDAELDINKRRALTQNITQHLEQIDFVQKATVQLTFPEKQYLTDVDAPVTASVVIQPRAFMSEALENRKTIRGLQQLIAMGVDRLQPEFVTISDTSGKVLTDLTDEDADLKIRLAQEELKIVEKERKRIEAQIRQTLGTIYKDRVETTIALDIIWDDVFITNDLIVPIVIREDNPLTPYDDSEVVERVGISSMNISEEWKGQQLIPQGAAGAEENIPAGYQEKTDRWQTYTKNNNTDNYDVSRRFEAIKKGAYKIGRVSAAIALDGRWEKIYDDKGQPMVTNNKYERKYIPVDNAEVASVASLVQAAIGYDVTRGDQVTVTHLSFDHYAIFAEEDEKLMRQQFMRRMLLISLLSLVSLFVLALIIRAIQKEMLRRRRLREEEQERKQMELRRQALLETPDETVTEGSVEDIARRKLLDDVTRISHERPEDVAMLLRTWMSDDK